MIALGATLQAVGMLSFVVVDPASKIWKGFLARLALSVFLQVGEQILLSAIRLLLSEVLKMCRLATLTR